MNYQEFLTTIKTQLSLRIDADATLDIRRFTKNNGTDLDGLIIFRPNLNISPTIYLNPYYHRYLQGVPMEDIYTDILITYQEHLPSEDIDVSFFTDFSKAKKLVTMRLVNYKQNEKMLQEIVQNTEMGKNTLEQIVPMTEEPRFKAELLRQRNIYRELNQEACTAITACGGTAQGQSTMAKLNTKMGISMKTLTDRSTRNLAEMLSEGSSQGVMDCIKSQKDYPDAAPGSKRLMQKLQDFEEDNRIKLEQFL